MRYSLAFYYYRLIFNCQITFQLRVCVTSLVIYLFHNHYNPHPKVDYLQKTLGLTLTLPLPLDSLPLLIFRPTKRPRTPPWRLIYVGAGWVHLLPLTQSREVSGVHECDDIM